LADAHPPREIARMFERLGVAKAQTDALTLVLLAVLAGAFISLGALFFTVVVTEAGLGFGVTRLLGGRSVADKILAILFPITAFVAIGFEHAIANWFFLPFGLALDGEGAVGAAGVARNLVAVTAGNIVGGTLLVAGVYWVTYLRGEREQEDRSS